MYLVLCSLLVLLQLLTHAQVLAAKGDDPSIKPTWNETWTDKLKRHLLNRYDKFARPAQHTNTTVVHIDMAIRHIDLDELKSIMTVHGWVRMKWLDEKLKWDYMEWGGLNVLHVSDHEIWQPDIVLYNSANGNTIDHYGSTYCLVYPNGDVLWVPPAQFIVFCPLNLRLWPFDTQSCKLHLGSWTYDGEQIDLELDELNTQHHDLSETNSEWELIDVFRIRKVKMYDCCDEPYIDVTYNLTMRRRSPTYSAIVITPVTVIVLMTLAVFWLPPQAGEKLLLSACTAIIICIFLLYFSQKLPAMAGHTPLVVLFYSTSLYLVCISMLVSVVVINLSRNRHVQPLPWFVKNLLTGWLGNILGLGGIVAQASLNHGMMSTHAEELREHQAAVFDDNIGNTNDDSQMIAPSQPRAATQNCWILLAAAIDRLTFLFYCLLFVIFAIMYAV